MKIDHHALLDTAARARESCISWLATMRTPDMPLGYFRFSEHAYHPWSLYASNAALAIYQKLPIPLSTEERQTWAEIFLSRYDPKLGLFLCPQLYGDTFHGDVQNYDDLVRADSAAPYKKLAVKLYNLIGTFPPAPDEGTLGFDSIEELKTFLEQKRLELAPYAFGSVLGDFFQKRTLWLRSHNKPIVDDPWISWGYDYLESHRNSTSGLLQGATNDPISAMNGLFKVSCSSYWEHEQSLPDGRKVMDTVLGLLCSEQRFGVACDDFNAALLLCRLCHQENGYRRKDILDTTAGSILRRMEERRQPDGGFSFNPNHCLTRVNCFDVSDPLPESDLFGTGQQLTIIQTLLELLSFTEN